MKFSTSSSWLLLAAPLGAVAAFSCTVVPGAGMTTGGTTGNMSTGAGGSGGAGGGTSGPKGATGKDLFLALQADIVLECGGCHKLGGVADHPFLAAPDYYASITTYGGIVVSNPAESKLLTHPGSDSHGGPGMMIPDLTPPLKVKVKAWLTKEAAEIPMPSGEPKPHIVPFKPRLKAGFNIIALDPLDKSLENASISFFAEEIGSSMLQLTKVEVHPVAETTIHIVHPLFTTYPAGGGEEPDPVDGLANVDESVPLTDPAFASNPLQLGTGTVILNKWVKDAYLGLVFYKIEVSGEGTPIEQCHNVAMFAKDIVPQLQYCASKCHAVADTKPTAMMNLLKLSKMPPDDACAQVRARIHPDDPATSDILTVTDPSQQIKHGYKFDGNKLKYSAFKAAVTPWITSEK